MQASQSQRRQRRGRGPGAQPWLVRHRSAIIRHVVINFFLLTILLPLFWVLLLSIKSLPNSMSGQLWPRKFDFTHYAYVFDKIDTLPVNLFNSIYVTAATVAITVFCAVLAGYALVHLKPRGGRLHRRAADRVAVSSRPGWSRSSRSTRSRTISA